MPIETAFSSDKEFLESAPLPALISGLFLISSCTAFSPADLFEAVINLLKAEKNLSVSVNSPVSSESDSAVFSVHADSHIPLAIVHCTEL